MAQRERYKATVKASKGTPPQQDFSAYHAKLKAEQSAARACADSVRCRRVPKNWPSPQKSALFTRVVCTMLFGLPWDMDFWHVSTMCGTGKDGCCITPPSVSPGMDFPHMETVFRIGAVPLCRAHCTVCLSRMSWVLQKNEAAPPNSPEAMQETASTVASILGRDEEEVLARLQLSAYGRPRNPATLPTVDQASCLL